jgi:hypothetical protein
MDLTEYYSLADHAYMSIFETTCVHIDVIFHGLEDGSYISCTIGLRLST